MAFSVHGWKAGEEAKRGEGAMEAADGLSGHVRGEGKTGGDEHHTGIGVLRRTSQGGRRGIWRRKEGPAEEALVAPSGRLWRSYTDCSLGKVKGARGPWAGKLVLEYMGSLEGC